MSVTQRRGRAGGSRRSSTVVVCLLACTSLLVACSDDEPAVDQAQVQRFLIDEEGLSAADAGCVSDLLAEGYDDATRAVLVDEGLEGLPSPLWGEYVISMISCTMGDELTAPGTAPDGAGG
jgi:hypothetical protein